MNGAYAYLRVSDKSQVKGDGFKRQLAAIQGYAVAHDLTISRVFEERGVSGTIENMNRPAWCELMAALHSNGIKTVLIERLDRLARDLMVQESALADLRKHGFTLVSVAEPDLMATDPTRIMLRQMCGAVAQYEKSQIVAKLRGARQRMKAAIGRCEGQKPYGHYPGEAETLTLMRTLWAKHGNLTAVCRALTAAGHSTRSKKPWHPYTISGIVKRQSG